MPTEPHRRDVVAVAIIAHGTVLAAQRTYPPRDAGRWELPGGKVEPGESIEAAAAREISEELGLPIVVTGALAGSAPIGTDFRLVAVTAALADEHTAGTAKGDLPNAPGQPSEPEADGAHSSTRWVGPEDFDAIDWLEPDRAFLTELRELLADGEPLTGGATSGAVRIGQTVRRGTGSWTPAVHDLLTHLRGVAGVPQVLGVDERGREILTYIPGDTLRPDLDTLTDAQLSSAAAMLRGIHDAMTAYRPAGNKQWRYGVRELQSGEVICHNDPGVYNWAFDGQDAVGLFDWDMAGPGDPIDDVAFLAWTAIPLYRDIAIEQCAARLHTLASGYGGINPIELLTAAARRMASAADRIEAGIARGDAGMMNLARIGEPDRTRARLNYLARHTEPVKAHLRARLLRE